MKSNFDKEIDNSIPEMLSVFGVDAWVRGVAYPAIFNDEEYEDETGFRQDLSVEIEDKHAKYFLEGDPVFVMGKGYFVKRLPKASSQDPFIIIGLIRA